MKNNQSNLIKSIMFKDFIFKNLSNIKWLIFLIFLGVTICYGSTSQDYLKPISDGVNTTFGSGSTFEHLLYIGEVGYGSYKYVLSKNPVFLVGIVVLMIFTQAFLT